MSRCQACLRRFRSKAAEELARRRRAVILDLQGVEPAEHLRPQEGPSYTVDLGLTERDFLDRHERHQAHSAAFRAGQI